MNTKHIWWKYIQNVVALYPERVNKYNALGKIAKKEVDAVFEAYKALSQQKEGAAKAKLIQTMYWSKKNLGLQAAATELYICSTTAKHWHGDFLREVARRVGVYDPAEEIPVWVRRVQPGNAPFSLPRA